jgi:hypothetical protein
MVTMSLVVERSLYERANGYSYDAVKIFCDRNGNVTKVPYVEHLPPDVTACIFRLKNRDPQHWRDSQQLEHVLGKYLISDTPMTPEQWARGTASRARLQTGHGWVGRSRSKFC